MKFKIVRKNALVSNNVVSGGAEENATDQIDIPNGTIAWGAVITVVIQSLVALFTVWLGNIPKEKTDAAAQVAQNKKIKLEVLQKALESGDSINRLNSLKLLIATDLLEENEKIKSIVLDPKNIPKWEKQPATKSDEANQLAGTTAKPSTKPVVNNQPDSAKKQ